MYIVIAILILCVASLLFLVSIGSILFMLTEFNKMKTASVLMESAFKDHADLVQGLQTFVARGLEGAEQQYTLTQENYEHVIKTQYKIQEHINRLEDNIKKPMGPDVTLN